MVLGGFFCLDGYNNILISEYSSPNSEVFPSAGKSLHTIRATGIANIMHGVVTNCHKQQKTHLCTHTILFLFNNIFS